MPKHVPTFKNLISTSHTHREDRQIRERGVSDLLEASRAQARALRDRPPHIPATGDARWNVSNASTLPMVSAGEASIHPAELVRRAQVAQRQAARSVAGPAPPMSWRSSRSDHDKMNSTTGRIFAPQPVTVERLQKAAAFFETSPSSVSAKWGSRRLVEHCLRAVLIHLEDAALVSESGEGEVRLCDIMREQVGYLDVHLKEGLLRSSSLLAPRDPRRLSDTSVRAILARPDSTDDGPTEDGAEDRSSGSDWDDPSSSLISHLPLTNHPTPISLLRQLDQLPALALTSLNLAYSTVSSLDTLVRCLPVGLRELSLCGVRIKGGLILSEHDANRALGSMSIKLIVLRVLDLSEPSFEITSDTLRHMIDSSSGNFPSLKTLGLRGVLPADQNQRHTNDTNDLDDTNDTAKTRVPEMRPSAATTQARKRIAEGLRRDGKQRWVDLIWD